MKLIWQSKVRLLIHIFFRPFCLKVISHLIHFCKKKDLTSQKVSPTDEPLISSINNQIPENKTIKTIDYVIYNSNEINYEDIKFIDENIYKAISEVNSSIDYYGTFENEDITDSESILEKYYRVVVGEETYINVDKDNENMEDDFRSINPNEYVYYQFNMDKDSFPELIVSDQQRYE